MISKRFFTRCSIVLVMLTVRVFAVDPAPVETQMRTLLKDKIIGLAIPYTAADLKFDANGRLTGTSDYGPWTIFGSIQINDIAIKDSSFEIDGERIARRSI